MRFEDGFAVLQQAGASETAHVRWDDVLLIVTGRLSCEESRFRERKTRRSENEIVNASEFASDESVIDFYSAPDGPTWRISANGFDFSCLGERMTLIANENIARLQQLIVEHATRAKLDDPHNRLRPSLDLVWARNRKRNPAAGDANGRAS